jgi:ribosome-binding factor A
VPFRRTRGDRSTRREDVSAYEPDPRRFFGGADGRREDDRKLKQLCRQAERAAAAALADCADEALAGAFVCGVAPAPDARRLAVTVAVQPADDVDAVHAALGRVAPLVRSRVAAEIHRKRAPEIAFHVRPAGEADRG